MIYYTGKEKLVNEISKTIDEFLEEFDISDRQSNYLKDRIIKIIESVLG